MPLGENSLTLLTFSALPDGARKHLFGELIITRGRHEENASAISADMRLIMYSGCMCTMQ